MHVGMPPGHGPRTETKFSKSQIACQKERPSGRPVSGRGEDEAIKSKAAANQGGGATKKRKIGNAQKSVGGTRLEREEEKKSPEQGSPSSRLGKKGGRGKEPE